MPVPCAESAAPGTVCPSYSWGCVASTWTVGIVAFSPLLAQTPNRDPLGFLAVLPLMWAALRRNQRDTASVALVLSGFALWGTLSGEGPFARATLNDSLLLLIMYMISTAVPTLALSADVARMSRLVNQLLSVAQLEALAVSADETADLQAIAVDVAASLAPLALKRGRSVAVTGAAAPVAVRGNAESLRQALRNLIENALQHTPAGTEVEIEVTGEPAVHVSDRGPGVPPELRNRVVQRFWRADRRKGEGSGLGLAIVSRILAAHGGRLTVDDAPGGGARFSLRLPARA